MSEPIRILIIENQFFFRLVQHTSPGGVERWSKQPVPLNGKVQV